MHPTTREATSAATSSSRNFKMPWHGKDEMDRTDELIEAIAQLTRSVVAELDAPPQPGVSGNPWRRDEDGTFRLHLDEPDDSITIFVNLDGRKGSEEYERALTAIQTDEVIAPHLGHLVGDANTQSGAYAEQLMTSMVIVAARGPEPDAAVRSWVQALYTTLTRQTRTRRVLAPLPRGFRTQMDSPVELDARASIRRMSDDEIATALHIGVMFDETPPAFGIATVEDPWAIDVTYEVAAVSLGPEEESPDDLKRANREAEADAQTRVSRLIHALRLAKAGRISPIGRLTISSDMLLGQLVQHTTTRFPRPPYDSYDLDDEAADRVRHLLALLTEESVESSPALQSAIRRFSSSIDRHDGQDRLVDLIISAEALFAGDSGAGDLSLRVAQRFARYLAPPTGVPVMDLFQHMKDAYGGRSNIVHALARTGGTERKIRLALDAVDETEAFMRTALSKALAETVDLGQFRIDWNRLVLEGDP
jgi:hypothetical protein